MSITVDITFITDFVGLLSLFCIFAIIFSNISISVVISSEPPKFCIFSKGISSGSSIFVSDLSELYSQRMFYLQRVFNDPPNEQL